MSPPHPASTAHSIIPRLDVSTATCTANLHLDVSAVFGYLLSGTYSGDPICRLPLSWAVSDSEPGRLMPGAIAMRHGKHKAGKTVFLLICLLLSVTLLDNFAVAEKTVKAAANKNRIITKR